MSAAVFVATPGLTYVEFESSLMGCTLNFGFETEDACDLYQFGPVGGGITLIEVWQDGADWSMHLTDWAAKLFAEEVYVELHRIANAAHQTRLDFYAPAAQFARIAAGREFV